MTKNAGAIGLILGGVALVYLGATGYLESAWTGLRGGYIKKSGTADPTGGTTQSAGQATGRNIGGQGGGRALGRGRDFRGGQVSNVPAVVSGVYYPSASGGMFASDSAIW